MEVVTSSAPTRSSFSLNPDAPLFVPLSFRTVEDFSDQWWHLIHSSAWFRDYWLRECFQEEEEEDPLQIFDDPLQDAFFDDLIQFQLCPQDVEEEEEEDQEEEEVDKYHRELLTMGALKWRRGSGWAELPRHAQKAPKIVKARGINQRTIQQPR